MSKVITSSLASAAAPMTPAAGPDSTRYAGRTAAAPTVITPPSDFMHGAWPPGAGLMRTICASRACFTPRSCAARMRTRASRAWIFLRH